MEERKKYLIGKYYNEIQNELKGRGYRNFVEDDVNIFLYSTHDAKTFKTDDIFEAASYIVESGYRLIFLQILQYDEDSTFYVSLNIEKGTWPLTFEELKNAGYTFKQINKILKEQEEIL